MDNIKIEIKGTCPVDGGNTAIDTMPMKNSAMAAGIANIEPTSQEG